jgi:sugar/nucleoside kinase (ribokinase family)
MRDKIAVIGNITVDRVVRRKRKKVILESYSPGGAINVVRYLKELVGLNRVILVSNIGDDRYAREYIEPELKKLNDSYVRRIESAETRLYEVDITDPERPVITRIAEAQKLMDSSYKDITPLLDSLSTLYFQSCTPILKIRYRKKIVELIRKAHEMKVPIILDWNSRSPQKEWKKGRVFWTCWIL